MALEIPGLKEYGAVREAYEKARALLRQESPNRNELSGLLKVLYNNSKGVELLALEEGEAYKKFVNNALALSVIYTLMEAVGYGKENRITAADDTINYWCKSLGLDKDKLVKNLPALAIKVKQSANEAGKP